MKATTHRERLIALIMDIPRHLEGVALTTPIGDMASAMSEMHLCIDLDLGPTRFCITHTALPPLDAVATVECHLGKVPERDAAAVYRRLLTINQRWAATQPAGFGLDRERETLVYSSPLDIAHSDTPLLIDLMQGGARLALMSSLSQLTEYTATEAPAPSQRSGLLERA